MTELFALIGAALIGIPLMIAIMAVIAIPLFALNGYVITKLWAWFIVPLFGLPLLNIPQAIGLDLVVTFLTFHQTVYNPEPKDKKEKIQRGVQHFARPLFVLLTGYIVHRYFI